MKYLPLAINASLIVFALALRFLIQLQIDIYSLRLIATKYTWVAMVLFLVMLIVVLVFKNKFAFKGLTVATSIAGIITYHYFHDAFSPW